MKVETLTYERLFRTGKFENERIGVTVSVDVTENPIDVFKDTKALVLSLHEEGKLLEESKKVAEAEKPKETEKPTLDEISSLRYIDKTGDKGPYKQANKSDNPNNPAFQKLQKYLEEHKGFAILHGFKFWQFSNNPGTIGRRKK
jgi:hypothetical protein